MLELIDSWKLNTVISTEGILLTSSAHDTLSTFSIVFIVSIILNRSAVSLKRQAHRMSMIPVTNDTQVIPLIVDIFCATRLEWSPLSEIKRWPFLRPSFLWFNSVFL